MEQAAAEQAVEQLHHPGPARQVVVAGPGLAWDAWTPREIAVHVSGVHAYAEYVGCLT